MTGSDLRKLRESAGLSQSEVARRAKLTRSALSRIESGERGLDVAEYVAIMRAMELMPGDYLLNSGRVTPDLMPYVDAIRSLPASYRPTALRLVLALGDLAKDAR